MTLLRSVHAVVLVAVCLAAVGCGDDDRMGGTSDAGGSANDGSTGGRDTGMSMGGNDAGPLMANGCSLGECNIVTNDGCADGQACYYLLTSQIDTTPEPLCQSAGTGAAGSECTEFSDCAEGLYCDATPGMPGHCQRHC